MSVFVVTYRYHPEPGRLAQLRPQRFQFFRDLESDGSLLASGQLLDDAFGEGLLIVEAPDRDRASAILDEDPFARAGLIAQRVISAWHPTVGAWLDRS